jgi:8-oxo-dGTP diphosphatase
LRQRFALSVSVFVIVHRGDDILLLRRANTGWKDGQLSLPAGAHDGGETLEAAAVRELREETGLVAIERDMKLVHLLHCHVGDGGAEWLGAFFLAERWTGIPAVVEAAKHDHLDWYPLHTLPADLIPYTKQGLEKALAGVPFSTHGWQVDE